jgi:23S rRNA (cytidine1920-2'-O)/16S rRNA (cytidine1409-2'-O)-methyltransferase
MRADQALVERGLVVSRSMAKRLIESGAVQVDGLSLKKPSDRVNEGSELTVSKSVETQYVSRSGAKLAGALALLNVHVKERFCLDLGQSTGGFTDCLLQHGAKHVIGIDVGHDQLVAQLRSNAAVTAIEGCNIRHLDLQTDSITKVFSDQISLIVIDLSFISLELIFPVINTWFCGSTAPKYSSPIEIISLVKPQFEVGKGNVSRQGIVTQPKLLQSVKSKILQQASSLGWTVESYFDSPLLGGDGNREFFLHAFINPSKQLI